MARPLRLDLPNCFYHVLNRGVERRTIFADDADCQTFIGLLGLMSERYDVRIWSYVLMRNHWHVLLKPSEPNLSRAMQWLGLSYAGAFNRRHQRSGPLFQGRFKNFIVEDGDYLRQLILYIHRNPLRAGMVERLADYPWSSYRCLAYGKGCHPWVERERVLSYFGGDAKVFREATKGYREEEENLFENLWSGVLLGSEKLMRRFREGLHGTSDQERPQTRSLLKSQALEDQAAQIAAGLGIDPGQLQEFRVPVRRRPRPMRDVLVYVLWRASHHSVESVAAYFGVRYTTIPLARQRGLDHLRRHRELKAKAQELVGHPI